MVLGRATYQRTRRTTGRCKVASSIMTTESEIAAESDDSEAIKEATTESEIGDAEVGAEAPTVAASDRSTAKGRRVDVSVKTLMVATIIVGLIAAVGATTWLYLGANARLNAQARQAADKTHAEQIALDYAVNAAVMDFKDLGPWKQNLVKGLTPELKNKLAKAADAMEQILLPLQWSSTAKPIAAKVRSLDKGFYVVDAFVSVMTKTVQAAENLQSTATYSITIDSNNGWQISDVGGIAAVVGDK